MNVLNLASAFGLCALITRSALAADEHSGFTRLFTEDGVPKGWVVRTWDDVSKPAEPAAIWKVQNGVLHGSEPRGTWLLSEKEYGDFILEFEWKLGEQGNSGTALRAPMYGDPAFDGMELQMVDPRYYGDSKMPESELTGSLYKAVAPRAQLFKPLAWNKYQITCRGPSVKVLLNGEPILDVNLDAQTSPTKRHNGTDAPPLKDRPRKGHLGFQELSRGGGHVEIRNVQIKVLD
jgi:3-keto-disaccharide hydrolase